ncbi:Putative methyltransferase/methylase [Mycobacterium tuberculosis]|nr:Putative methyltransferase/methylase [Mycobacterium tuberculosis]
MQDIGWDEKWQCDGCSITHQRDDNAAINLARYEEPVASSAQLGPPSSVEPTVRPGLARRVAVKRGREPATRLANNPETGC